MKFFRLKRFIVKWTNYEYWPWFLFFIPTIPFHLWYALRSGYLFFNTVTNPGIDNGGLFGESKIDILNNFSDEYKPKTFTHMAEEPIKETLENIKNQGFQLPLIIKPNIGERGAMVEKVDSFEEIEIIIVKNRMDFIIQEYIDYAHEFGVLYGRIPGEEFGSIRSIVLKDFLSVTGDGKSSVAELLLKNERAWFQMDRLKKEKPEMIQRILPDNEKLVIEPIGNHCRGTEFINGNHLITDDLNRIFDKIAGQFKGFYYGRFDLKARSIEEFKEGKTIKIFELNGVTSEPGHIYDKNYTLGKAYRDIIKEIVFIYKVCQVNIKRGHKPLGTRIMAKLLFQHFKK